jgi:hypothetical protein
MLIANVAKGLIGELFFDAFDFLQAQNIGLLFGQKLRDLIYPKTDRVNIPRGGFDFHDAGIDVPAPR